MEFWQAVLERLREEERSQAWLCRRIGIHPPAMSNYIKGYRPTPERVRQAVALVLDIREARQAA